MGFRGIKPGASFRQPILTIGKGGFGGKGGKGKSGKGAKGAQGKGAKGAKGGFGKSKPVAAMSSLRPLLARPQPVGKSTFGGRPIGGGFAGKSGGKALGRTLVLGSSFGTRPGGKVGGKSAGKSAGKSVGKAGARPVGKFGGKSAGKFAGKSAGKSGGKAAASSNQGQWVFVPDGGSLPKSLTKPAAVGARHAKGSGKAGKAAGGVALRSFALRSFAKSVVKGLSKGKGKDKGKGKGKGKVLGPQELKHKKTMEKLSKVEADHKVWVGGLSEEVTRGNLVHHFKDHVKPSIVEIMRKGTGCISFKSAEDATTAIELLNGSELQGKTIQVDVWTQREKKPQEEGNDSQPKKNKLGVKTELLKKKQGKKGEGKGKGKGKDSKVRSIDPALKIFVAGLKGTSVNEIKTHFSELGCDAEHVELMGKNACVAFKDEADAQTALAIVNGSEIKGNTLELKEWRRPGVKKEQNAEEEAEPEA